MEAKWLSAQTIIEKSPDAAPDETERVIKERGSLDYVGSSQVDANADKAHAIAENASNEIVDNMTKVVDVMPTNINP